MLQVPISKDARLMKARALRLPRNAWRSPARLSRLGTNRGYTGLETERSRPNVDIDVSGLDPDPEHRGSVTGARDAVAAQGTSLGPF